MKTSTNKLSDTGKKGIFSVELITLISFVAVIIAAVVYNVVAHA